MPKYNGNGNGKSHGFKPTGEQEELKVTLVLQKGNYVNKNGQVTPACTLNGLKKFNTIDGVIYEDRNRDFDQIMVFASTPTVLR